MKWRLLDVLRPRSLISSSSPLLAPRPQRRCYSSSLPFRSDDDRPSRESHYPVHGKSPGIQDGLQNKNTSFPEPERLATTSARTDETPTHSTSPEHTNQKITIERPARLTHQALRQLPSDSSSHFIRFTGLVHSSRKQKSVVFAHVQDGTFFKPIQAVLDPELGRSITNGAYVSLIGRWQPSKSGRPSHELIVQDIEHVGVSNAEDNPIQKKNTSDEFLRNLPHMRMRVPLQSLVGRARSRLISITAQRAVGSGPGHPIQVHPPVITSSDCEGAGEVFTVDSKSFIGAADSVHNQGKSRLFFREPKYLTVSNQFHLEAYAAEYGNVWSLAPTFRAETSDTPRHLAEFYMLEAEYRDIHSLEALARRAEDWMKAITLEFSNTALGQELLAFHSDVKHRPPGAESVDLQDRWRRIVDHEWVLLTYDEAIASMKASTATKFAQEPDTEKGLQLEHERWLVENLGGGGPVIVTNYPKHLKPFYMLPSEEALASGTESRVACFDILIPCGYAEVCGGSLREHRLEHLIPAMRERGMLKKSTTISTATPTTNGTDTPPPPPKNIYPFLEPGESLGNLEWYADLRRYGSSPHGGFGIGFDRLVAYLVGVPNVRDVVGFPRTYGRAEC